MIPTAYDCKWMQLALREARRGIGLTSPNPAVGAAIVKDGVLLGKGWHQRAGQPHAEREALADARSQNHELSGATIYVTLEPCSSHGRTPPCTDGIMEAGITRVVYGAEDPNPAHRGRARELLTAAGVDVCTGVEQAACEHLLRAFAKKQVTGIPWVLVKSAISLDGRITRPPGEGQWLTSAASREQVQALRFESDAIITGGNTLRIDDPALTIRSPHFPAKPQPWRMVITRGYQANLPAHAKVFTDAYAERTLVQQDGDLLAALKQLADRGCNQVMVEAGGVLLGAFLDAGLVDEVAVFYAPMVTGGADAGFAGLPREVPLHGHEYQKIGDDVYLRALVTRD
ncbi:bifunctional diaminohydroxyphosphoribosylaminopyrimidine deaminase/5-amino-6-(5-phosphoribosylamino)uracil reductase RibD [Verrucomicrobiaceae bacterium R5-34]|nr:bifunctional diaminohydroxyphosphoribosylaminopyrimidine deaminase/5-amino-6-(5-phosphoribosylamino)uracil reductase RibD [Verrucomicrobiaceae bacterium R5-34]